MEKPQFWDVFPMIGDVPLSLLVFGGGYMCQWGRWNVRRGSLAEDCSIRSLEGANKLTPGEQKVWKHPEFVVWALHVFFNCDTFLANLMVFLHTKHLWKGTLLLHEASIKSKSMQISVLVSSWCSAYVLFAPRFADLHLRSMKKNWGHASKGGQFLDTKIETTNETTNKTLQFYYDVQRKLILSLDSLDLFDFWDGCILVFSL